MRSCSGNYRLVGKRAKFSFWVKFRNVWDQKSSELEIGRFGNRIIYSLGGTPSVVYTCSYRPLTISLVGATLVENVRNQKFSSLRTYGFRNKQVRKEELNHQHK